MWNRKSFLNIDAEKTDYLMGLFANYEMGFAMDKKQDWSNEPTLDEMVQKVSLFCLKTLKVLGFF